MFVCLYLPVESSVIIRFWFALVGGFDTELRWWYVFDRDGGWVILQYWKAGTTAVSAVC